MKLDKKLMIQLLKEEYDKRIMSYLSELDTKAKHTEDGELIKNSKGLKIRDRAGFLYTIMEFEQDDEGVIFVYLAGPGKGDKNIVSNSNSVLYDQNNNHELQDTDYNEYVGVLENDAARKKKSSKIDNSDIVKPKKSAQNKKDFKLDINYKPKEYEKVNGLFKITLDELEKEFTL